jgi:hypothetical protein
MCNQVVVEVVVLLVRIWRALVVLVRRHCVSRD